jgi:putative membrane protein
VTHPPPAESFTFEPLFVLLAAGAAVAYARAARGRAVPVWRMALFGLGLVLVVAPLNSPLETLAANYLVLAHLLQNAVIADWAPPLLILGLTPGMRAAIERRGGRPMAAVTTLPAALAIWLTGWYLIHLGPVYDGVLRHPQLLNLEHAVLISIGLIFWWPVLGSSRALAGDIVLYLLAAFVAVSFLGLAFTFITHPFYSFYLDAPRVWGLSPSEDQNLGGVVMNAEQSIVFLSALVYAIAVILDRQEREQPGYEE